MISFSNKLLPTGQQPSRAASLFTVSAVSVHQPAHQKLFHNHATRHPLYTFCFNVSGGEHLWEHFEADRDGGRDAGAERGAVDGGRAEAAGAGAQDLPRERGRGALGQDRRLPAKQVCTMLQKLIPVVRSCTGDHLLNAPPPGGWYCSCPRDRLIQLCI